MNPQAIVAQLCRTSPKTPGMGIQASPSQPSQGLTQLWCPGDRVCHHLFFYVSDTASQSWSLSSPDICFLLCLTCEFSLLALSVSLSPCCIFLSLSLSVSLLPPIYLPLPQSLSLSLSAPLLPPLPVTSQSLSLPCCCCLITSLAPSPTSFHSSTSALHTQSLPLCPRPDTSVSFPFQVLFLTFSLPPSPSFSFLSAGLSLSVWQPPTLLSPLPVLAIPASSGLPTTT